MPIKKDKKNHFDLNKKGFLKNKLINSKSSQYFLKQQSTFLLMYGFYFKARKCIMIFTLRTIILVILVQSINECLKSAWQNMGFAKTPPAIPKAYPHLILHIVVIISTPFLKKQINVAIFQLSIFVHDDRIVRYDRESRRDSNIYLWLF